MTQAVANILEQMEKLSEEEQAELADCVRDRWGDHLPADVEVAHLKEVKRRIAEVESGEVKMIPGDEAMAYIRQRMSARRLAAGQ